MLVLIHSRQVHIGIIRSLNLYWDYSNILYVHTPSFSSFHFMTFCSSFSYFQVDLFYINNGYLITRQFSNQNMTLTYYDILLTFVQWFPLYDALLLYSSYSAGVVTYIKYMGIRASVNLIAGPRLHAKTFHV